MLKRKSGFTLMEIMVVIIVIAVLASVAGPMIGSITDQGRTSATKSKLSSLKSALLAYQNDVGRLPYKGNKGSSGAYDGGLVLNTVCAERNCLSTNSADASWISVSSNYQKRWKGPYMDSEPSDFMYDSWGNKILYIGYKKNVYLWSAGADGDYYGCTSGKIDKLSCVEDAFKEQSNESGSCDDIVVSVAKLKSSLGSSPTYTGF